MTESINERNKVIYEMLGLLNRGQFRDCLFEQGCTGRVVNGHGVSEAILRSIEDKNHVKNPQLIYRQDEGGNSHPHLEFKNVGVRQASIGTFACQTHEDDFKKIDTTPMDFEDPEILNLLLYRAVLREIWLLSRIREATDWVDDRAPHVHRASLHPNTRLESLLYFREGISPMLTATEPAAVKGRVQHMVRRIRSDSPILATSSASGGSVLAYDHSREEYRSAEEVRARMGIEPYSCWGLTIIPQEREHMVLASWLEGSQAQLYFQHLSTAQGRELEEAVSAELILFSENWFLSPRAWDAYGTKKQEAILTAFGNYSEMLEGRYSWLDKKESTPWYEYLNVPNRHQLNLFRYNQAR